MYIFSKKKKSTVGEVQGSDVRSVSTLLRIRRVQKHGKQYYIQVLLPDTETRKWQTVTRGYVHKTSADAALGREVAREMKKAVDGQIS